MSMVTLEEKPEKRATEERIAELKQELQKAELAAAIEAAGTLNTMEATGDAPGARLGPTVFAPIEVNGITAKALIDTGSPATIISLEFVLRVLAEERPSDQILEQWNEATHQKFASPDLALNNYGGQRLSLIAQIELTLSQGDRQVQAVVLVQKDAPNDLLLGTDLQPRLGFTLSMRKGGGEVVGLLGGGGDGATTTDTARAEDGTDCSNQCKERAGENELVTEESSLLSQIPGEVRLLQPIKVPAGYQKLVRGSVDSSIEAGLLLFTPLSGDKGLLMADSAVELGEDRFVTLVIQNYGTEPVHLEKGVQLGAVDRTELMTTSKEEEMTTREEPDCVQEIEEASASVQRLESDLVDKEERKARLLALLDLNLGRLPPTVQRELETLLASYSDVFALDSSELGTTDVVTHLIVTGDHRPSRQPVRRTPFALREKVDTLVREMLEQKVIEPSESPWASPIVLVQKKNGGVRFCVDYRKLNGLTKLDEFPLPRIDDTLDLLSGARYFTTLDLASGYWQVAMEESSKEKTAFTTYSGLYQFKKMPFGLVNAPATFQRLMEVVLSGLARTVCLVYLDNILVIGKTLEEHNVNLGRVLERMRVPDYDFSRRSATFLARRWGTWDTWCLRRG